MNNKRVPLNLRPNSLLEVSLRVKEGSQDFGPAIREFLDEFYFESKINSRQAMILDVPELISPIDDAYLAAVAEHLARLYNLNIPNWVDNPDRFLHEPYFPFGLESLKAYCIVNSPLSFRKRMIFTEENPLRRASQNFKKESA